MGALILAPLFSSIVPPDKTGLAVLVKLLADTVVPFEIIATLGVVVVEAGVDALVEEVVVIDVDALFVVGVVVVVEVDTLDVMGVEVDALVEVVVVVVTLDVVGVLVSVELADATTRFQFVPAALTNCQV
jgi:hypothetical protein